MLILLEKIIYLDLLQKHMQLIWKILLQIMLRLKEAMDTLEEFLEIF